MKEVQNLIKNIFHSLLKWIILPAILVYFFEVFIEHNDAIKQCIPIKYKKINDLNPREKIIRGFNEFVNKSNISDLYGKMNKKYNIKIKSKIFSVQEVCNNYKNNKYDLFLNCKNCCIELKSEIKKIPILRPKYYRYDEYDSDGKKFEKEGFLVIKIKSDYYTNYQYFFYNSFGHNLIYIEDIWSDREINTAFLKYYKYNKNEIFDDNFIVKKSSYKAKKDIDLTCLFFYPSCDPQI